MFRLALVSTIVATTTANPTCTSDICCQDRVVGMCSGNTHDSATPAKTIGEAGYADADVTCDAGTTLKANPHTLTQPATGVQAFCCEAILCEVNQHVSSNVCTDCPTGKTRAAGDDASGADTACETCDADYYASAADTCTACDAGRSNAAGDSIASSGFTATTCDETCDADYYASAAGTCTECPAGKTNEAGDSIAADGFTATTCDVIPGWCSIGGEDFECGSDDTKYVANPVEESCTVAEAAPDGTTCTLVPATYLDILQGIATNPGSCTASTGTASDCTYAGVPADCPDVDTEDKTTSDAQVATPFGIALAAVILLQ